MKICILLAVLLTAAIPATAQDDDNQPWKKQVNIDAGLLFPGGDAGPGLNMGWGAAFTFYYQLLSRHTFVSLSVAYNQFPYKNSTASTLTVIPFLAGMRYNFSLTGFQPYVGVEFGLYMLSSAYQGQVGAIDDSQVNFGVMPKLGVRLPLAGGLDFDGSLKWHNVLDDYSLSFIGLNAGIAYTID